MPPKRARQARTISKTETIASNEDAEPSRISTRAASKRKAVDELDLFDIPDSIASSPIATPARKRQRFEIQVTPAESNVPSTYGEMDSPSGSKAPTTPATSLSDDESDHDIRRKTRRIPARASAAKRKSFKVESESELSDHDELQISTPRYWMLASERVSPKAKTGSDEDDDDFQVEQVVSDEDVDNVSVVDGIIAEDEDDDDDLPLATTARRARRQRTAGNGLSQYQKTMAKLAQHHPDLENVWGDLETKEIIVPTKAAQPEILTLKLLPFQLEGLYWLRKQEQSEFRGGILADEMGMGKTIQTVSMLVSDTSRDKLGGEAGTLIVAPTVALMQWKSEISLYTNNALTILIYHGANRETSIKKLKEYDIVLTTYNLLESVWRKQQSGFRRKDGVVKEKSILHSIKFHRIVLDEAHNIKDRSCGTARAVFNLQTDLRWCLSGTPLQNRVGELFSLLRFLQADPFSYYYCKKCPCKSLHWKFTDKRTCDDCHHKPMDHTCWFNHELLKPIQRFGAEGEGLTAFKKIHNLLRRLMLRRTKIERADDMGLPPRVVNVRRDLFNDEEEDLYESLYTESKRKFNTYADQGTVLNNYANIFQLITRMRQMADHPDLILKRNAEAGQNSLVCRICDDTSEDAIKAKCHHIFCRSCVQDYQEGFVGATPDCPVCHLPLNIDLTAPALETANEDLIKRNSILNRIDMSKWRSSTKIEALVEELYKLRAKDSSIKSIVFSQWTSFLELVNWRLRRAGFSCCKLDGTMTPEARANTINHFSTDPSVSVFLVSLKAGGVALNLTEASVVFLSDPWWNPSAEVCPVIVTLSNKY
ncbi:protein of unknown function [Taphrina deformans PYCC 5710]|uniref:DNA repair protein RAD16 n=1 Tax=Taphrina deformans (strain PYCC 5710 / ATCC 11124 / CBS 356.35 / IMI 108563 / JCM 9778 / NBRC 8474) TaxID=1097556 RepID=R4XK47_TAPDE|nr:protein of unknown function [Taphrina deformans PYCC 5710]|eukprot:CCG83688.1 protein of unknown function [Taphrina deformans PYCC 5710]